MSDRQHRQARIIRLRSPANQRGVVLLVSLIFLAALALISVTVMQTSTLELRMAGNEQEQVEAVQKVHAVLDEIGENDAYFPVIEEDYLVCTTGDSRTACNVKIIDFSAAVDTLLSGDTVTSQTYYRLDSTMPRASQSTGEVYDTNYRVAYFDIDVSYQAGSERGSDRDISQGMQSVYRDMTQNTSAPDSVNADMQMQAPVAP
ncbi:MAG: pilus assembly PilX N-terminal domain-containing protein [Cellvibrionaceae bacterium]